VLACIDHVARALGEAHGHDIVHRDVKPENILCIEDIERSFGFSAKLIDFGLANVSAGNGRPEIGPTAGTPSYMSPEYLRADVGPTPALDLWGVAATAFVAMTGIVPFDGATLHDVYRRVCMEPPPVPSRVAPHVPPGFDAWFARACSHDPDARFRTAAELAAALASACERGATASRPDELGGVSSMATEPDSARTIEARDRTSGS
jgi:serine/threonine-protein kinase